MFSAYQGAAQVIERKEEDTMRGTALVLVLIALMLMGSGCYWAEAAMKYGARGGLEALNSQIPVLSKTMKEEILKEVNSGIEKMGGLAADKSLTVAMAGIKWMIRQGGKDPMAYDFNNDGKLSIEEGNKGMLDASKSGEWPWYLKALFALGVLGGGAGSGGGIFSILKTMGRYRDERQEKKTRAIVNGGAPATST